MIFACTPCSTKNEVEDEFLLTFRELGFDNEENLQDALEGRGLWSRNGGGSHLLRTLCRDYYTCRRVEQLSRMLQEDFHLGALQAHIVRCTLWRIYAREESATDNAPNTRKTQAACEQNDKDTFSEEKRVPSLLETLDESPPTIPVMNVSKPLYKKVQLRSVPSNQSAYGLISIGNDTQTLVLRQELDQFWHEFMTRSNPYHPTATPLRNATAKVYATHATLFLGWYLQHHVRDTTTDDTPCHSLRTIFADASVESVSVLLDFVRWLREDRNIAASYEANVWRGLTKLLQFRFSQLENKPANGLENLPALLQVRKWHREASRAAAKAPRRSHEDRKWLSWEEYLHVVKQCKQEFLGLEHDYEIAAAAKPIANNITAVTPQERKIAIAFQRYLVLAIFATVPDRQRTIRELEINKSLVKDSRTGMWCIKHSPNDYKTGKTYGERPSLQLHGLTDDIDLFLERWRPKLQPSTDRVFVQQRTCKPLTQDSVYQIVGRACYQFTGQRTNPHLLRDMIVTHVRESTTTSEAELEALAMLMGHSVAVQRASYDRRTLTQRVAPAVELMQQVNSVFSPAAS